MRRALAAALGGAALLLGAGPANAALEPVSITARAPATVTTGSPLKLEVSVAAEAGALDIAAQPLLLGVKLAPECGGSLVGTPGAAALERTLPTVPSGSAFSQTFVAEVPASGSGTEVVCAFLQDSQERQFATDTEAEVTFLPPGGAPPQKECKAPTKELVAVKHNLKRLDRRIAKLGRQVHRAQGAHRRSLLRKLHKLRTKRRGLARQRRQLVKTAGGTCS